MYAILELINFPVLEFPELVRVELHSSIEEAVKRTNQLLFDYNEEYGEDWYILATKEEPFACAGNGDVKWWSYIHYLLQ